MYVYIRIKICMWCDGYTYVYIEFNELCIYKHKSWDSVNRKVAVNLIRSYLLSKLIAVKGTNRHTFWTRNRLVSFEVINESSHSFPCSTYASIKGLMQADEKDTRKEQFACSRQLFIHIYYYRIYIYFKV